MAELDELLRASFARIADAGAPRADSAGVADAIRARVAAGDPGAPAEGPVAPGRRGRFARLLPWAGLALVVVLGVGGVVTGSVLGAGPASPSAAESDGPVIGTERPRPTVTSGPSLVAVPTEPATETPAPSRRPGRRGRPRRRRPSRRARPRPRHSLRPTRQPLRSPRSRRTRR